MLETLGDHSQRKSLDSGYRFFSSLSVHHHSGDLWDLRDPPAIVFALDLDEQVHWRSSHFARTVFSSSRSMRDFIWLNSSPLYFPCGQRQWIESLTKRGMMCQWQWSMI